MNTPAPEAEVVAEVAAPEETTEVASEEVAEVVAPEETPETVSEEAAA